jgi:hypothetical protein
LKLGECGEKYKKDGQVTNWKARKEDGKDYTFEYLCGILINYQHRLLKEGNLGGKH